MKDDEEHTELQVAAIAKRGPGVQRYEDAVRIKDNTWVQRSAEERPMAARVPVEEARSGGVTPFAEAMDDEEPGEPGPCARFAFVFGFMALFGGFVAIGATAEGDSYGMSPTRPPTNPPGVFACPSVFDLNNRSVLVTNCSTTGCGGLLQWCGLDTNKSHQVVVGVKGDFGAFDETVTVELENVRRVTAPVGEECGTEFVTVLDEIAPPGAAAHTLIFDTSRAVHRVCGGFAVVIQAVLVQV